MSLSRRDSPRGHWFAAGLLVIVAGCPISSAPAETIKLNGHAEWLVDTLEGQF